MSTSAQELANHGPKGAEEQKPPVTLQPPVAAHATDQLTQRRDDLQRRRFEERHATASTQVDLMTRLLRGAGAVMLLVSASTFLLQHWQAGNDSLRYAFLLAHAGLLVIAAVVSGKQLGESRSARVFLWTAMALVPICFAVLGGLVYSQFAWGGAGSSVPAYATWVAPSGGSALLMVGLTLPVAGFVAALASRVLAGRRALVVAATFVGLNGLLLLPVRSPDFAGPLAALAGIFALVLELRVFRKEWSLDTIDGRLVRALFWVPAVIIAARTALYYPSSDLFAASLIAAAGLGVFWSGRELPAAKRRQIEALDMLGTAGMAGAAWIALNSLSVEHAVGWIGYLPVAMVILLASRFARARNILEVLAAVISLGIVASDLADHPYLVSCAIAVVVGVSVAATSVLMSRWPLAVLGAVVSMAGALMVFERAIGFEHIANWGTLSVLGIVTIFGAAFAERAKPALRRWILSRFAEDEARLREAAEQAGSRGGDAAAA